MDMDLKTLRNETNLPFGVLKKIISENKKSKSKNVERLFRKYMGEFADKFSQRETRYKTYGYFCQFGSYAVVEILSETNTKELTELLSRFAKDLAQKLVSTGSLPNLDKYFIELKCMFGENIKLGNVAIERGAFTTNIRGAYQLNGNKLCIVTVSSDSGTTELSYLKMIAKLVAKNAIFYYGEYKSLQNKRVCFRDFLYGKPLLFCDDYANFSYNMRKNVTIKDHLYNCAIRMASQSNQEIYNRKIDKFSNYKAKNIVIEDITFFGFD